MASTFTTNLSIELPGHGDYNNTWDVPLNADLTIVDTSIGGKTSLNVTAVSGTVVLTVSQYRPRILLISGVLTANVTYQIPSGVGGFWYVFNTSSGAFSVTLSSGGGGTSVVLAQGYTTNCICDGTNVGRGDTNPAAGGVTTFSGGTTGLTPASASPGAITLAGTLAIANGGTGQTSATAAFNALAPTQSGNAGRYLTTNGTTVSWGTVSGSGTVTSVDASGGTTGLTFSGGPVTSTGTLTLSGTLSIASGGTGSTSASGARAALNAASGGVNVDIASLSGLVAGSVSSPSLTFFTSSNTGMYLPSVGNMAVAAGGVRVFDYTSTNVQANVLLTAVSGVRTSTGLAPATSSSAGLSGLMTWDTSFFYVCTATNTWKRIALSTF